MNYCIASCVAKIVIRVNNIVLIVNGSLLENRLCSPYPYCYYFATISDERRYHRRRDKAKFRIVIVPSDCFISAYKLFLSNRCYPSQSLHPITRSVISRVKNSISCHLATNFSESVHEILKISICPIRNSSKAVNIRLNT